MMFRWYSELLKQYGYGSIFVDAADVEDARRKALAEFDANPRDAYGPIEDRYFDDELIEAVAESRTLLLKDLAKEPIVQAVFFVPGSE
jgi:hypothetical protein